MSDKYDPVLDALMFSESSLSANYYDTYPPLADVRKAIAVQKQQMKAIESAQAVRGQWEYSGLSAGDEKIVNSMCEELSKLDAMKGAE